LIILNFTDEIDEKMSGVIIADAIKLLGDSLGWWLNLSFPFPFYFFFFSFHFFSFFIFILFFILFIYFLFPIALVVKGSFVLSSISFFARWPLSIDVTFNRDVMI